MNKEIAVIILAAGKGERMKSDIPKVMHKICGRNMLAYVLDLSRSLKPKKTVVVLGHKHELVREIIPENIQVVVQKKLIGTADAVKQALPKLKGFKGTVLVLYGDTPLLKKESVDKLLKYHLENNIDATLLTAQMDKPKGYGRVLRDKYSSVMAIAEEKDADDFEKDIKEVNTGIMCFNKISLESALKKVRPNNRKNEYYLTDAISILYKENRLVDGIRIGDIQETLGVNSRLELAKANSIMQERINEKFMLDGITIVDPRSTFINYGTKIGQDTVIYPFTVVETDVKIGKRCFIGPFAHLREGARVSDDVTLGNFVELVRSKIGAKVFAKHFSYIGDTSVGAGANIGAGAVTANFDGRSKHRTVIKDNAFIGSDTVLIAPVKIGKGAMTGAGSVVLRDIPDNQKAVGVPAKILGKKE
ncbi:MAG: NTP transferase domain-containing protein [Candidatus Omnitrophota bacterium]|jgi:bifunctional UDP-N-acetylglucosamine pyrophosphorylase/glucosamine-1-phosphate N-acetyltransferase